MPLSAYVSSKINAEFSYKKPTNWPNPCTCTLTACFLWCTVDLSGGRAFCGPKSAGLGSGPSATLVREVVRAWMDGLFAKQCKPGCKHWQTLTAWIKDLLASTVTQCFTHLTPAGSVHAVWCPDCREKWHKVNFFFSLSHMWLRSVFSAVETTQIPCNQIFLFQFWFGLIPYAIQTQILCLAMSFQFKQPHWKSCDFMTCLSSPGSLEQRVQS